MQKEDYYTDDHWRDYKTRECWHRNRPPWTKFAKEYDDDDDDEKMIKFKVNSLAMTLVLSFLWATFFLLLDFVQRGTLTAGCDVGQSLICLLIAVLFYDLMDQEFRKCY
jgi:hypothetical protein